MADSDGSPGSITGDVGSFDRRGSGGDSPGDWMEIHETLDLAVSPDAAWAAFNTFGAIDGWHPATSNCRLILGAEGAPGAIREFDVEGGGEVMSELLSYDDEQRHFRYRILKTNLPLYAYIGEMSVRAGDGGGSTVHWSGTFKRPPGTDADQDGPTRELVQAVFDGGLAGIEAKVSG